ncbi:MAG: glycosyltransferase involved in cell wall biosynthesis [Vicingaceae bacterium]
MDFILSVTTFNRINYLKSCINSWVDTRSENETWKLLIADDGSTDGTLNYLDQLSIDNCEIITIKNNRIGVHQQMNTILHRLETISFDMCFKVDDDITFLKKGWDYLYLEQAIKTGYDHLVFCDTNWCTEQQIKEPIQEGGLIARTFIKNAHGFFYTITPQILKKVGYFDADSFGFRGMGHVDFTMRCARAGFTSTNGPWDIVDSNNYICASKENYQSVLKLSAITAYDEYNRVEKEEIINQVDRIYIPLKKIDRFIYNSFQDELILALTNKVQNFEKEKGKEIYWYKNEIHKIKNWYESQYDHLPNWFVKIGKLFKLLKQ